VQPEPREQTETQFFLVLLTQLPRVTTVTSSSTPQQAQSSDLRQPVLGLLEQVWLAQQEPQAQPVHLAQLEQLFAAVLVHLQVALAATVTSTSIPLHRRSMDLRLLVLGLQV
jgi:hypothetical protein